VGLALVFGAVVPTYVQRRRARRAGSDVPFTAAVGEEN
jgi:hypothetical protein